MVNLHGDVEGAYALLKATPAGKSGRAAGFYAGLAALQGKWDEALEIDRQGGFLEIFDATADFRQARRYMHKGERETARGYIEAYFDYARQSEASGRLATGFRNMNLAEAYAWIDDRESAMRHAQLAVEAVPAEFDHVFGINIERRFIRLKAWAGEREFALQQIAAKLDQPGGFSRWQLHLSRDWDFFRDDPRFNDLVRPDGVEPEPFRRLGDGT
jgi:tetratricopeptide (TPR) repeat protein